MNADELRQVITDAFEADRVEATRHFFDELRADQFVLADVRCALDSIMAFREFGEERESNAKYELTGPAMDGRELSVECSFKDTGALLLITVYEGRQE
jgi:hypothetical protein